MRQLPTFAFFVLCVALVACGGSGGATRLVPAAPSTGAAKNPGSGRTTMLLHVPPPAHGQTAATLRRMYIPAGTQAFGVAVFPAGSLQTPSPSNAQIFPVATPSPCAAATGGGYTCTLNVTAPFGEDVFYVAAFATASPAANATPLSIYESGTIDVSASPNPNATPLSFSLDAVPASITLSVPSPDPGNTPNTQVFTVSSPASVPLDITVQDAAGNNVMSDPTATFESPVTIQASPSTSGIGLQLSSTCASSPSSTRRRDQSGASPQPSITLECASDADNVQLQYDGAIAFDSSGNVVDRATIVATSSFASPAPSPAYAVLQSTVFATPLPISFSPNDAMLLSNQGNLIYVGADDGGAFTGTFDTSTFTMGSSSYITGASYPLATTIAPDNSYWLLDADGDTIDCWSSYALSTSTNPTQIALPSPGSGGSEIPGSIVADGSGHIWYTEFDTATDEEFIGYFASGNCSQPGTFPTPYVLANIDGEDSSTNLVGLTNGAAFNSTANGVYVATTSGVQQTYTPQLGNGSTGGGIAADGAQTVYASFYGEGSGDLENVTQGSVFSQIAPTSPVSGFGPFPQPLAAFSPTGGAADRLAYGDNTWAFIGLLSSLNSTPSFTAAIPPLINASFWSVVYGANGIPFALYANTNSGATIAAPIETSTWNVPVTTTVAGCYGTPPIFTIDERGDSGSFTWTFPQGGSETPFPGSDHIFVISPPSYGSPFQAVVQDGHGRTESYELTVLGCPD